MALLDETELDNRLDLPVSLPGTLVLKQQWLVVSTVQLLDPIRFTLRWLQLQLIEVVDPFSAGVIVVEPDANGLCVFPQSDITLENPDYGLAYLALFRSFVPSTAPSAQAPLEPPLIVGSVGSPGPAIAVRSLEPVVYATPGLYSFVIVNNTTNRDLRLTANGQLAVTLVPLDT